MNFPSALGYIEYVDSRLLTGHLKWKGTLMGALLEMELGSTLKISVSPMPYVQGGSDEMTS